MIAYARLHKKRGHVISLYVACYKMEQYQSSPGRISDMVLVELPKHVAPREPLTWTDSKGNDHPQRLTPHALGVAFFHRLPTPSKRGVLCAEVNTGSQKYFCELHGDPGSLKVCIPVQLGGYSPYTVFLTLLSKASAEFNTEWEPTITGLPRVVVR